MKRIITTALLALSVLSLAFAQDLYIRFNLVPAESGILTSAQSSTQFVGKPILFENETPSDAYLMDVPVEGSDIYTKTFTLPAGDYEYQVVFADGTGAQGEKNAWYSGRPFTVTEEQAVVFRAKVVSGYIKYLCDAQDLYFSSYSDGSINMLLNKATETGRVEFTIIDPNYKGNVQGIMYPKGSTSFVSDVLPIGKGKYTFGGANGKVKWLLLYNRHTIAFESITKLVTLLDTDLIDTGSGLAPAGELVNELGEFSTSSPLLLAGGTRSVSAIIGIDGPAGAEKANNLLKIAPENIEAKMYYTITPFGEETPIATENSVLTTTSPLNIGEFYLNWRLDNPVNVTSSLSDGSYTLNIWYETFCHSDIVKSNVYTTSFSVDNTATGYEAPSVNIRISTVNNTINALFEEAANVKLYSATGQLIDQVASVINYVQTVERGVYILTANNKSYKILVK